MATTRPATKTSLRTYDEVKPEVEAQALSVNEILVRDVELTADEVNQIYAFFEMLETKTLRFSHCKMPRDGLLKLKSHENNPSNKKHVVLENLVSAENTADMDDVADGFVMINSGEEPKNAQTQGYTQGFIAETKRVFSQATRMEFLRLRYYDALARFGFRYSQPKEAGPQQPPIKPNVAVVDLTAKSLDSFIHEQETKSHNTSNNR